jgi:hypothetical protein
MTKQYKAMFSGPNNQNYSLTFIYKNDPEGTPLPMVAWEEFIAFTKRREISINSGIEWSLTSLQEQKNEIKIFRSGVDITNVCGYISEIPSRYALPYFPVEAEREIGKDYVKYTAKFEHALTGHEVTTEFNVKFTDGRTVDIGSSASKSLAQKLGLTVDMADRLYGCTDLQATTI